MSNTNTNQIKPLTPEDMGVGDKFFAVDICREGDTSSVYETVKVVAHNFDDAVEAAKVYGNAEYAEDGEQVSVASAHEIDSITILAAVAPQSGQPPVGQSQPPSGDGPAE